MVDFIYWVKFAIGVSIGVMLTIVMYRLVWTRDPTTETGVRNTLADIHAEIKRLVTKYHSLDIHEEERLDELLLFLSKFPDVDSDIYPSVKRLEHDINRAIRIGPDEKVVILASIKGLLIRSKNLLDKIVHVK